MMFVPLAAEPLSRLSGDAALKLAEWYVGLMREAGVGGGELMASRARACYLRFFEVHKERGDALALRAELGIQKVGGSAPDPSAKPSGGKERFGSGAAIVRAALVRGEIVTDLRLAELAAARPDVTRLTRREIGSGGSISDVRPLARLRKLTALEVRQAGRIADLGPLGKATNLKSLTLLGLTVDDLSGLGALRKLTALNISGAGKVSDIGAIGRLRGLRSLQLRGCVKVSDLKPLSRLAGLKSLNLSGCSGVSDLGPVVELAKTLTSLDLSGTGVGYILPLAKLKKLKTLDLRRCADVAADDAEWLAERLSGCNVLWDAPPKESAGCFR